MVSSSIAKNIIFHLYVLFAARSGNSNGTDGNIKNRGQQQRKPVPQRENSNDLPRRRGRQRYAPNPTKRDNRGTFTSKSKDYDGGKRKRDEVLPDPPPLTKSEGPFPTYLTCRHTYEDTLIEEITTRSSLSDTVDDLKAVSPYPGLVRVEGLSNAAVIQDGTGNDINIWDPVYALQMLPECRVVECENSIKGLARAICEVDDFQGLLTKAPRGSLSIHALVPGMCKGQREPVLQRRSYLVAEAVTDIWKKQFPAARKKQSQQEACGETTIPTHPHLLCQILLLSPDVAAVSLTECQPTMSELGQACWWPNPKYPMGMAQVDITSQKMPSSAYRKLLEAFACWGIQPSGGDTVVDLGASPGGWTAALLLYCDKDPSISDGSGIHVTAVDRAPLEPKLMKDPRVDYVQGDAFTFEPENGHVDWMVSDIIAYPERVLELIHHWCGKQLATYMIVTMKFQGTTPSWEDLEEAIQVAKSYQYFVRAKHFFNNKNEITLMLRQHQIECSTSAPAGIASFYKTVLPKV